MAQGRHLIADIVDLPDPLLETPDIWLDAFSEVASNLKMTILASKTHIFSPPRKPGYTAFILVDSSHFSVHVYSDVKIAAVDIFVCKNISLKPELNKILKMGNIPEGCISRMKEIGRF